LLPSPQHADGHPDRGHRQRTADEDEQVLGPARISGVNLDALDHGSGADHREKGREDADHRRGDPQVRRQQKPADQERRDQDGQENPLRLRRAVR